MFYEIKGGKIAHALRDVAYQSNTLEFWNSCDLLGGQDAGSCTARSTTARASRRRSNPVSHGCPPARFRDVNVLDTSGRKKG